MNVSLNTFCAHSQSAKVKSGLCTCGIGREETEEQPSMGHPWVLFGTAIWEFLHPRVYSTCRRDKQWWLSENWGPLQSHRVCRPFPGVQEAKLGKRSFQLAWPFPSPPSHPALERMGVVQNRLKHERAAVSPARPARMDLPPTRLQESFQVVLINSARFQHKPLSTVNAEKLEKQINVSVRGYTHSGALCLTGASGTTGT